MRRNRGKRIGWLLMVATMLSLSACNRDDENFSENTQKVNRNKVCVIAPSSQQKRWERTAKWALANIAAAQKGLPQREELELVWMNEETLTKENYRAISEDVSYVAVVGPFDSKNAEMLAEENRKVNMLLPTATSAEFQRKFASTNSVWNLAESDIAQLQVMLAQIGSESIKEVALITRKGDPHGVTFADWIGFFATEHNVGIEGTYTYESENDLKKIVAKLNKETIGVPIIFDAGNDDDAIAFDKALVQLIESEEPYALGNIRCTDKFVSENIAKKVEMTYEGLDLCASPASGFSKAYEQKFGEELFSGEAQFYDAFLLLSYALTAQRSLPELKLNDAIKKVVTSMGSENAESWLPADSHRNFGALQNGTFPIMTGVSGSWAFESKSHSSVMSSTYRHWRLVDGKYYTMDYLTAERVAAWNMTGQVVQAFDEKSQDLIYPPLKDQWCLLVATSTEWADYRHQSDVYGMYQIMKRYGFKDDHIVLIAEDNLAYHPSNPLQGQVLAEPDQNNVYQNIKVDYKISQIKPDDLKNILCGNSSEHLPEVIKSGINDNVFIFWSGHGERNGFFKFGGSNRFIASAQLRDIFSTMHNEKKYRKMFMAMEACYSGLVGKACRGIPGTLFMTAANDFEPSWSWADSKNNTIGPFLSDKFARYFQTSLEDSPYYSFQSLYKELAKIVPGSHVSIYNELYFGNMYKNNVSEFIVYNPEFFK